jgi:predicted nucleic acid-binding protein
MAAMYFDTSALVKRYVAEVGSAWTRRALARPVHQVMYTAALSQAEVISALQRLVREGRLEPAQAQRITQRVTRHFTQPYQVLRITRTIVTQVCAALERYPLRAYDAVHLACALTVRRLTQQRGLPPPLFVAADDALLAAAAAEGFAVDNPLLHP